VTRTPDSRDESATATMIRGGPNRPSPIGAILGVLGARATPRTFQLTTGGCIVGSGPGCDIVINEATVSRTHLSKQGMNR
jgi:hypothetical protein